MAARTYELTDFLANVLKVDSVPGDYEGTVILIRPDRDFLDRVVTSVIAPEGDGRWFEYAMGAAAQSDPAIG